MRYNKVELCEVNTSKLKVLTENEKREPPKSFTKDNLTFEFNCDIITIGC